ncbi:MAG TPA: aminotransferase class I/II-fold pyridoxal phosphate-dependent enzyme [bacterium]|nr:aminotransferase class I/II-fold pyridoxal phosphate-dependent enzyme [bacterium]
MSFSFEHGGDLEKAARLAGCDPAEITDFSNLLNPASWPLGLEEALRPRLASAFRHPSSGIALKLKIAEKLGILPEQIFLGAGTTEFIHFLPLFHNPQKPVIVGPTYGDYAPALRRLGVEPTLLFAREENNWVVSVEEWKDCLREKPDWIILSRPNNPLGQSVDHALLREMIQQHPEIFFVVDETCVEIADDPADHFILKPWLANLAVLRSFSKTYAVPGLRLGYMVVSPEMAPSIKTLQMPWTVSSLAQAAGLFLLHQDDWLAESQKKNRMEKENVFKELQSLKKFKPFASSITAFTIKGLNPHFSSTDFLQKLLIEEKILIRSLAGHSGLGDSYFRVGLRKPLENEKLLKALRKRDS